MKTGIATALSIAGVLVAGSAAALANTQILSGNDDAGASAAVLPPSESVDLTVPEASPDTTSPSTTLPDSSARTVSLDSGTTSTTAPTAAAPSDPVTSEMLTTFNVGDAGSVTLDVIAGRLRLVDASAADGWRVTEQDEDDDGDEVDVEFRNAAMAVEFEAHLIDGQIVPRVTSRSLVSTTTATATATGPTTTIRDDDEDDDRTVSGDDDHDESDDHGDDQVDDDRGDDQGGGDDQADDDHDDDRDDD